MNHRFKHSNIARVVFAALAVAVATLTLTAPGAHAGLLVSSATGCASEQLERPFVRWADPFNYVLAPGGTLETTGAWKLSGGAVPVPGNESYFVHAAGERQSLALPPGSSATTAAMCVGIEHPTLRLFARNGGSVLSTLVVEVIFEDALGLRHSLPVGAVVAGDGWGPTLPMPVVASLLPLLPGARTPVRFRFTPIGAGQWQIDDVYVDPYRK
jgi:hypothetical protein